MTLTKTRPKTDREIQLDVLAEINRDWRFKPAEIGVEVDHGVVTLTGTVSSYLKLGEAAEVATRVSGVKDVANKLSVELPGWAGRDDTKIAAAVREALTWDATVPEERIESVVRGGVVTLRGAVDHWYQRASAVSAVKRLLGVTSVNDHIVVAPPARTDEQLHLEIKTALTRRFPLEDIDVTVEKGTAILMGTVATYRMRREAEHLAWTTIGVKNVTSKILID